MASELKLAKDSARLKLHELPKELSTQLREKFSELFALHPSERGVVIMPISADTGDTNTGENKQENKDYICRRWFQSYLNTPKWNPELKTSYMFSGMNPKEQPDLPEDFRKVLDWLNSQSTVQYNQVVANWYLDGSDYIPFHSDYEYNAVPGTGVVVVNLTQDDTITRKFVLKPKMREFQNECIDDQPTNVELELFHGRIIEMHGDTQKLYRHGVPAISEELGNPRPRISLTFRAFQ